MKKEMGAEMTSKLNGAYEKIERTTDKLDGIAGLLFIERTDMTLTLDSKTANGLVLILNGISDEIRSHLDCMDEALKYLLEDAQDQEVTA